MKDAFVEWAAKLSIVAYDHGNEPNSLKAHSALYFCFSEDEGEKTY